MKVSEETIKTANESGILPVEYKVLVKMDAIESTSAGGIVMVKQVTERDEQAQVYATLVNVGGNAFEDWKGEKPKPGDRVMIAKFAGLITTGADGERYRVINDKDVAAVIFKEVKNNG